MLAISAPASDIWTWKNPHQHEEGGHQHGTQLQRERGRPQGTGQGHLIKAAFGIEEASYTLTDERITFAWFSGEITPETSRAYADFIGKICEMARRQKRVLAKAKEVENPKYAFRCFLLRLGMIGDEYKTSRRVLLQNLSGNSAWKSGHGKAGAENE